VADGRQGQELAHGAGADEDKEMCPDPRALQLAGCPDSSARPHVAYEYNRWTISWRIAPMEASYPEKFPFNVPWRRRSCWRWPREQWPW